MGALAAFAGGALETAGDEFTKKKAAEAERQFRDAQAQKQFQRQLAVKAADREFDMEKRRALFENQLELARYRYRQEAALNQQRYDNEAKLKRLDAELYGEKKAAELAQLEEFCRRNPESPKCAYAKGGGGKSGDAGTVNKVYETALKQAVSACKGAKEGTVAFTPDGDIVSTGGAKVSQEVLDCVNRQFANYVGLLTNGTGAARQSTDPESYVPAQSPVQDAARAALRKLPPTM